MRFGLYLPETGPDLRTDKERFLKRLSESGIRYVEPCLSLHPESASASAGSSWTEEELKEDLHQMKAFGVSVNSVHLSNTDLQEDLPELLRIARECGLRQFVIPAPEVKGMEQLEKTAGMLTKAADTLVEEGLELLLGSSRGSGKEYADLLALCGETVKTQPDVGWLLCAGLDPETFLWEHADRIRSIHYRDMIPDGSGGFQETGLGKGILDTDACFQFSRAHGLIQTVAQSGDSADDFEEETLQAIGNLKRCCWSHGHSRSVLCILDTVTGELRKLHHFDRIVEAPNWHQQVPDLLYFNSEGTIWKYSISRDEMEAVPMTCQNCNNDHVLSPDGTQIAVSAENPSQIFICPIEGGEARQITSMGPSYLHGWSVHNELCYCAFRTPDGKEIHSSSDGRKVDVFSVSTGGGDEKRLTDQIGYNDGCEYSPDGEYIWYCSTRSGYMQVFRMRRDGSEVTQMTFTEENNWFGHISPDGTKVAYLTFDKDSVDPDEHLPNLNVRLGLMNSDGSDPHTVLSFFGGQGSVNVNSWSPDSRHLALVVYELIHK